MSARDDMSNMMVINPVRIGREIMQTTSARQLHEFLQVGKDFSSWIKGRIEQYDFNEQRDYMTFEAIPQNGGKPLGGRPSIEYAITLDMAKELAMVERNAQGKQARQYFIECERRAVAPARQLSPAEMFLQNAQMMVDIEQRQLAQGEQINRVYQRVTDMADSMLMLTRPAGAESIVHIRARINAQYGLPSRIIDEVMRQSPIAPKPAGMVKHSREEALGGSYAVYWVKDVSAVFARFVGECHHATSTQATHPYISGRFKLVRPHEVGERPAVKADPTSGTQANLNY